MLERAHACAATDVSSRERGGGRRRSGGRRTGPGREGKGKRSVWRRRNTCRMNAARPGCIDRETRCDVGVRQGGMGWQWDPLCRCCLASAHTRCGCRNGTTTLPPLHDGLWGVGGVCRSDPLNRHLPASYLRLRPPPSRDAQRQAANSL